MNIEQILKELQTLYEQAVKDLKESTTDFDTGRVYGIKQAIETIRGLLQ